MEEAATPLPSEETTPPVTNIYFGAILVSRAVNHFTATDFSYLSGEGFVSSPQEGFRVRTCCKPWTPLTYTQL